MGNFVFMVFELKTSSELLQCIPLPSRPIWWMYEVLGVRLRALCL